MLFHPWRDICAEALFEEAADDQSLPVAVLDALIKVCTLCSRRTITDKQDLRLYSVVPYSVLLTVAEL